MKKQSEAKEKERTEAQKDDQIESKKLHEVGQEEIAKLEAELSNLQEILAQTKKTNEEERASDQQEFKRILKEKQAAWKEKTAKIRNDFKELFAEYKDLQSKYDSETAELNSQIEDLIAKSKAINSEAAESLDLTKIQLNEEMMSKFEDEKSLLMTEYTDKLKARVASLLELMNELGVEVDDDCVTESAEDFSKLIEMCKVAFQNYHENKTALQQLIDEREDVAREKEDMGFELERANAELNFLKNQFAKSDVGKLEQQVATLNEESREMKNDFIIKFASYTEQIETLKSKLSEYESQDQSHDDAQQASKETSREYRAKYNIEDTVLDASQDQEDKEEPAKQPASRGGFGGFMASLFLTDSEMDGRGGMV